MDRKDGSFVPSKEGTIRSSSDGPNFAIFGQPQPPASTYCTGLAPGSTSVRPFGRGGHEPEFAIRRLFDDNNSSSRTTGHDSESNGKRLFERTVRSAECKSKRLFERTGRSSKSTACSIIGKPVCERDASHKFDGSGCDTYS
ncbi:unnamed protein product [Gongylonema pulchrum]|uniref:Uncharacterized protein n=1 Tax=Gongylonema pulchrum TaxID=637853 RepID=A0A183DKQ2_9BILA|nr:unnamed protein product [Gongylonema pulchrum]